MLTIQFLAQGTEQQLSIGRFSWAPNTGEKVEIDGQLWKVVDRLYFATQGSLTTGRPLDLRIWVEWLAPRRTKDEP